MRQALAKLAEAVKLLVGHAPPGPWSVKRVEITTTPWRVTIAEPQWTWQILWFAREAEAIAVRDALNRVAGRAAPGDSQ